MKGNKSYFYPGKVTCNNKIFWTFNALFQRSEIMQLCETIVFSRCQRAKVLRYSQSDLMTATVHARIVQVAHCIGSGYGHGLESRSRL